MLLGIAFVFLPVVIVLVMSRIFHKSLLMDGSRGKLILFFILCVLVYVVLLVLIAQVNASATK